MKIGVISDTHIPYAANDIPKQVYEDFKDVSLIIHAGDLVELSVLDKLNKIAKTHAVSGNMDSLAARKALPEKEIVKVKNFKIGVVHGEGPPHGLPELVMSVFKKGEVDAIVFGHSHSPLNVTKAGVLLLNPGSPTDKIFAPYNSYAILEATTQLTPRIIRLK